MNRVVARTLSQLAALAIAVGICSDVVAATATLSGQVNTDADNRPFFNSSTGSLNLAGYVGSVGSNASTTSTVTGTGYKLSGTSILSDLSDGNHIPMGVTIVHDLSFRVTGSANLFNSNNAGIGVGSNNLDTNETLLFDNLSINTTFIDPLGLLQPGASGSNPLFRALRSNTHAGTDSSTVSTDSTQSDPELFDSTTHYIPDSYATGVITPRNTVYIKTNAGSWQLKGIEYQGTANFNLATSQPGSRRTFKFGEPLSSPPVYDGAASHSILDNDTTVTITAVGAGTPGTDLGLDTNEVGVGVNSAILDDGAGNGERRIDGTLSTPEAINITFDKKVSLESLTIHNYEQNGTETAVLSFVSGTNPFSGQTGYSSDYTFDANSVKFKRTDPKGDTPYVITFGMGAQDDVIIEAGTTLSLTANPVTGSGFILAMLTASVIGVPGDYNNNGTVDAGDYVVWRKGGPLANEVDAPGAVNDADYTEWRARFGNPNPGSGVSTSAIPEPTTIFLLSMAAFVCRASRHRSRVSG